MGLAAAPGGCGSLSRAQSDGGGVHFGFQMMSPVLKDPVGVGCLGRPIAIPYEATTSPSSITLSSRDDRLTTRRTGGSPRKNPAHSAAGTMMASASKPQRCKRFFQNAILPL